MSLFDRSFQFVWIGAGYSINPCSDFCAQSYLISQYQGKVRWAVLSGQAQSLASAAGYRPCTGHRPMSKRYTKSPGL